MIFSMRVGFTPAPGSSKSTNLASVIIVRPISRSFFWPPDKFPANSLFNLDKPKNSKLSNAFSNISFSLKFTFFDENQLLKMFSPT